MAVGGSTNAIVHLVAMAGRAGIKLPLEDFDEISRSTPRLADLRPAGRFLMEDFYFAGGLRALLAQLLDLLDGDALRTGQLARNLRLSGDREGDGGADAEIWNPEVIRPRDNPVSPRRRHRGPARQSLPEWRGHQTQRRWSRASSSTPARRSSSATTTTSPSASTIPRSPSPPDTVMVLQSAGPIGAPGMPEWGMLPLPKKLLEAGVRDLLRISDARMSGTSYGACILHVAPESPSAGRSRWCATAT